MLALADKECHNFRGPTLSYVIANLAQIFFACSLVFIKCLFSFFFSLPTLLKLTAFQVPEVENLYHEQYRASK